MKLNKKWQVLENNFIKSKLWNNNVVKNSEEKKMKKICLQKDCLLKTLKP